MKKIGQIIVICMCVAVIALAIAIMAQSARAYQKPEADCTVSLINPDVEPPAGMTLTLIADQEKVTFGNQVLMFIHVHARGLALLWMLTGYAIVVAIIIVRVYTMHCRLEGMKVKAMEDGE